MESARNAGNRVAWLNYVLAIHNCDCFLVPIYHFCGLRDETFNFGSGGIIHLVAIVRRFFLNYIFILHAR